MTSESGVRSSNAFEKSLAFVLSCALAAALLSASCGAARSDGSPHRILILYPFDERRPASTIAGDAFPRALVEAAPRRVQFYSDFLDLLRFRGEAHQLSTAGYLAKKYEGVDLDLVVAPGQFPLRFILQHRDTIAPGARTVYCCASPAALAAMDPPADAAVGRAASAPSYALIDAFIDEGVVGGFTESFPAAGAALANLAVDVLAGRAAEPISVKDLRAHRVDARELKRWGLSRAALPSATMVAFDEPSLWDAHRGLALAGLAVVALQFALIIALLIERQHGRRVEARLRESEERYRVVAETASDAILTIDSASVILFANRAAEEIFGYAVAEMIGRELTMLMPEYLRSVHRSRLRRYLETGQRHTSWEGVEFPGRHKDGHIIPLELSFAEYRNNGERCFTGIVRNITERKRAEEELRESEERYRNVVETQNELICRYLPDGTLTFVNDAYCRYFGRLRDELVGTNFAELLPPGARRAAMTYVESLLANPRAGIIEHEVLRPDGSTGWQQWIDHVILDSDGAVVELQGIGRDVTELKLAEKEVRARRVEITHLTRVAMLGELSAAIAHEINQPLTAILWNAQAARHLLDREPLDRKEIGDALEDIVAQDNRAGEVIHRLRGLLRREDVRSEPIHVGEVVRAVQELLHSELIGRQVTIETGPERDLPPVLGDPVQLEQVLLNLVVNAMDAMAFAGTKDRRIKIESRQTSDGSVEIVISDNGPGIAAGNQPHLFRPFFTTKPHGLGLGLSICSTILDSHGGELSLANKDEGGGAIARVRLPAAEALAVAK